MQIAEVELALAAAGTAHRFEQLEVAALAADQLDAFDMRRGLVAPRLNTGHRTLELPFQQLVATGFRQFRRRPVLVETPLQFGKARQRFLQRRHGDQFFLLDGRVEFDNAGLRQHFERACNRFPGHQQLEPTCGHGAKHQATSRIWSRLRTS